MSNKVFKIALPGKDVNRARLQDEVVDSHYPNPKIDAFARPVHAGLVIINWNSSTTRVPAKDTYRTLYSFPHGYNYVPAAIGNWTSNQTGYSIYNGMLPQIFAIDGANAFYIVLDSDLININVNMLGLLDLPPVVLPFQLKVRFSVFAERGKE